jgi:hypothetical protein
VWAVQAGLDWLWEMPAVSLPVLLLAAGIARRAEAPPAALRATEEPAIDSALARATGVP